MKGVMADIVKERGTDSRGQLSMLLACRDLSTGFYRKLYWLACSCP